MLVMQILPTSQRGDMTAKTFSSARGACSKRSLSLQTPVAEGVILRARLNGDGDDDDQEYGEDADEDYGGDDAAVQYQTCRIDTAKDRQSN